MFKLKIPKMVNDIICPHYNVATLDKNACVIEGVRYVYLKLVKIRADLYTFQSFTEHSS